MSTAAGWWRKADEEPTAILFVVEGEWFVVPRDGGVARGPYATLDAAHEVAGAGRTTILSGAALAAILQGYQEGLFR